MKKHLIGWGIVALLILGVIATFPTYNKIVKADLLVETREANVQTHLQKRADQLGNAAETVKGYATQEQKTFIEVAAARAGAAKLAPIDPKTGQPATKEELAQNEALRKKFAENQAAAQVAAQQAAIAINQVREAYPQLQSAPLFTNLMNEIKANEEQLVRVRVLTTQAIKNYNGLIRVIPGNIIAKLWGFKDKHFFEADADAKKAPKIKF